MKSFLRGRLARISASLAAIALSIGLASCDSADSAFKKTASSLPAPRTTGGLERIEFTSTLLGKKMGLYAYLPPDYAPDREWPVLYLLHGFSNDEIEWFEYHRLNEVADRLIAEGKMESTVIIAPRMDNSWGLDSGKPAMLGPTPRRALFAGPYESYFLKEVAYLAETRYHASKKPALRSLGGISMGGFAALHIGLRHPGLFAKVGGHSPALRGTQIPEFFLYAKPMKRETCDPIELAKKSKLSGVRVFVDCGSDDSLFAGAKEFADILAERKVDVTFYTAPGGHTGEYWHPNLERYLLFYAGK